MTPYSFQEGLGFLCIEKNIFESQHGRIQNLKLILLVFGHILGLKINLDKSTLPNINMSQDQISRLALMLECKVSKWHLTNLGLPLLGNLKATIFCDPMVDKLLRRLNRWKKAIVFR